MIFNEKGDDFMTMVPMYKKCQRCNKMYSWNPDVGKMWCPTCGPMRTIGTENTLWETIKDIFGIKKK